MNKTVEVYITKNYYNLLAIAKRICKTNTDIHQELLHEVILQLYDKERINLKSYDDNSIKYYITAVMRINYYSKTSPFYYKIRRERVLMNVDISTCYDLSTEQESFETEELYELLEQNYSELDWFRKSLMDMWLTMNTSMAAVSRKTTIPIQSISRYIKEAREQVKTNVINKLNQ